jgi:micrococcal nuclease
MFVLVLACIYWLSEFEPPQIISASDIYVIDGDTIDIDGERYRLVGFDTPETYRAECESEKQRGDRATARLRELVASATEITLDVQQSRDKYGRFLGNLLTDGDDVGDILVREDLARRYTGGQRQLWC